MAWTKLARDLGVARNKGLKGKDGSISSNSKRISSHSSGRSIDRCRRHSRWYRSKGDAI